jgi:hypothetical protein
MHPNQVFHVDTYLLKVLLINGTRSKLAGKTVVNLCIYHPCYFTNFINCGS